MLFLAKRRVVTGDAGQTYKENIMVCKNTATNSIFANGGILGDDCFNQKRQAAYIHFEVGSSQLFSDNYT